MKSDLLERLLTLTMDSITNSFGKMDVSGYNSMTELCNMMENKVKFLESDHSYEWWKLNDNKDKCVWILDNWDEIWNDVEFDIFHEEHLIPFLREIYRAFQFYLDIPFNMSNQYGSMYSRNYDVVEIRTCISFVQGFILRQIRNFEEGIVYEHCDDLVDCFDRIYNVYIKIVNLLYELDEQSSANA